MLLGTLGASLLGNMLTGKAILRPGYENKEGKGILRAGYGPKNFKFHLISFFNKYWNTEVLTEWIQIGHM